MQKMFVFPEKCTLLICEGIYCMCYFRLRCGVNEMFTLLGCSSHSPFITPLSSPYSYPRLGQIYFLLSSPSKSTFISLTLHPVAPTSLLTRSSSPWHLSLQSHSACLPTMFLIPFFFPPPFHVFFMSFLPAPGSCLIFQDRCSSE